MRDDDCAGCRSEAFWNVAEVVRAGEYAGPLRAMIVRLKYSGQARDADYLGRLLAGRIAEATWFPQIDALVPVPMHRLRQFQRPCNHAHVLAESCLRDLRRATGAKSGLALRAAVVRRSRYSASQTRKATRQARFENVRDCFGPRRRANLTDKTVCIIDNLLVSGATVTEVSKVLRRLGAKRIYVAVLARTPPPGEVLRRVAATDEAQQATS
jgi:competence protein ComFC